MGAEQYHKYSGISGKLRRLALSLVSCLLSLTSSLCVAAAEEVPVYKAEVINTYPHDPQAFTQGLVFHEGQLYEGTGRKGQSTLRRVALESGEQLQRHDLNSRYFGEGITIMNDRIYQLTWQSHVGFVYDLASFNQEKSFFLAGEGWGITNDDDSLYVSDGSAWIRVLDPESLTQKDRLHVMFNGQPLQFLNELEFINGEIWANIWYQDVIARIDPETGNVNSLVDLSGIYPGRRSRDEVLHGIAWDAENERLFVTGKLWSSLFEIKISQ
jgi:glutaminyl-peptide cyclotransferase